MVVSKEKDGGLGSLVTFYPGYTHLDCDGGFNSYVYPMS